MSEAAAQTSSFEIPKPLKSRRAKTPHIERAFRRALPFAARTMRERYAGKHPLLIDVVWGLDWTRAMRALAERDPEFPCFALNPCDYRPGLYDLRVFAGVHARVIDGEDYEERSDARWTRFFQFLGELARAAKDVWFSTCAPIYFGEAAALERKPRLYHVAEYLSCAERARR